VASVQLASRVTVPFGKERRHLSGVGGGGFRPMLLEFGGKVGSKKAWIFVLENDGARVCL
jgi:hypothetical protein